MQADHGAVDWNEEGDDEEYEDVGEPLSEEDDARDGEPTDDDAVERERAWVYGDAYGLSGGAYTHLIRADQKRLEVQERWRDAIPRTGATPSEPAPGTCLGTSRCACDPCTRQWTMEGPDLALWPDQWR